MTANAYQARFGLVSAPAFVLWRKGSLHCWEAALSSDNRKELEKHGKRTLGVYEVLPMGAGPPVEKSGMRGGLAS